VAQLSEGEILRRIVAEEINVKDGIPTFVDRTSGQFRLREGLYLDFKEQLRLETTASVAEIARDILAFSNTEGGLLLIGVADNGKVIGHEPVDTGKLRASLGACPRIADFS
jgi:hypothetical protein